MLFLVSKILFTIGINFSISNSYLLFDWEEFDTS